MNVAILQGPELLNKQLLRSLQSHQIKGDLITQINNIVLIKYDFLIVSSEQHPKLTSRVLEQIVLKKQVVLVYIHHQSNIVNLYNLIDDPYFLLIPKVNVIETLPSILITIFKWQREVRMLKSELKETSLKLTETQNTIKAKRILINKGMSEIEAHNWIQKVAMDKRCKKSEIVNLIIEEKIDIG